MLILTRRAGQTVMIGEGVSVTVLEVKGGRTRLGINAPRDVSVQREEIYRRTGQNNDGIGAASAESREPDSPVATG